MHAEAIGDRRVELQGFTRDALALLAAERPERAHVVQAIREFYQNDANVLGHRHGHLLEVLGLGFGAGLEDGGELGYAVDDLGHLLPEACSQRALADPSVFDNVVKESGHQGLMVHVHAGEDMGDGSGVGDVRVPRLAHLPLMGFLRIGEGPLHLCHGVVFEIGLEALGQHLERDDRLIRRSADRLDRTGPSAGAPFSR